MLRKGQQESQRDKYGNREKEGARQEQKEARKTRRQRGDEGMVRAKEESETGKTKLKKQEWKIAKVKATVERIEGGTEKRQRER